VTKPGGLYRARQQAELAASLGLTHDIGGSIEMGIGNAANLHLGAAMPLATLPSVCPVTKPAGAAGPEVAGIYYLDDVVTEPFRFEDGKVMVPAGPGLGVEVDVEKLAHYAV
jgi:muconate cycloisomerase